MKFAPLALCALMAALMPAMAAQALPPINQDEYINKRLLQGYIADQIADTCPTIEPRNMRALAELNRLKNYALSKGYSAAEIRAFVTSKTEKARGKEEAATWLMAQGAKPGNVESYCLIGEAEIARKSLIGTLLRSTR